MRIVFRQRKLRPINPNLHFVTFNLQLGPVQRTFSTATESLQNNDHANSSKLCP
jgi:hypothetical protein